MLDTREHDDSEISALKDQLLSLMSSRGLVETEELIRKLGWDAESYGHIGELLIQAGVLLGGGKKGGKLGRVAPQARPVESESQPVLTRLREKSLYAPVMDTLSSAWVLEYKIQDYVIDLTASQGGRVTGGKWSRPDITMAISNEYTYVPSSSVELRTFEIKTHEGLDITAVYEALSHRRAAHFAHVLVHVPECESSAAKANLLRVIAEAEEHGVGLTTFEDPRDYKSWRVEVDARRANPDPALVDAFIEAQTGDKFQRKMLSWCRRV